MYIASIKNVEENVDEALQKELIEIFRKNSVGVVVDPE